MSLEQLIAFHAEGRAITIGGHLLETSEVYTRMFINAIPHEGAPSC